MTITLTREEAQQVLDALEDIRYADISASQDKATELLRARLAQPEPEPVAYKVGDATVYIKPPIYTAAPPQREWRGLTKSEVKVLWMAANNKAEFAELLEAKLKHKNHPPESNTELQ